MIYQYDDENVFAKILRGDIPCDKVLETEHSLAFNDISPRAPVHILLIPKGAYVNFDHFGDCASEPEIADFTRALANLCRMHKLDPGSGGQGYRLISNAGSDGVQEVQHYHVHLLGGKSLGIIVQPR